MNDSIMIILAILVAGILGAVISSLINKKSLKINPDDENRIELAAKKAMETNNEQFITLAKEILSSQQKDYKIDFENKQGLLNKLIEEMRTDLRSNQEKLARSEEDRIRSFSALKNELETYKTITGELKMSTENLRRLLQNNQMRGAFGEQIAENLLRMAGFVVGQDYVINQKQTSQDTRPDFTLFLPDKTKINIDVKFPYQALIKVVEAQTNEEKSRHDAQFRQDVKNKIKQVCNREYINPEDRTVDFVILFIPNEMIFSYIYDKMNEVWEEAMAKKVVLAGPFSFTAILRMVKQAYTNFRYQENLQHIIGLIQKFDNEYKKFSEEIDRLGDRLNSASKQFEVVSTTRNRQLTSVVDKIKNQEIIDKNSTQNLLEE